MSCDLLNAVIRRDEYEPGGGSLAGQTDGYTGPEASPDNCNIRMFLVHLVEQCLCIRVKHFF